jgi:hypothetical protein
MGGVDIFAGAFYTAALCLSAAVQALLQQVAAKVFGDLNLQAFK